MVQAVQPINAKRMRSGCHNIMKMSNCFVKLLDKAKQNEKKLLRFIQKVKLLNVKSDSLAAVELFRQSSLVLKNGQGLN